MRLVIVSNRLQVTVTEKNNSVDFIPSSGGLITGIGSYFASLSDPNYLWIGWPGSSSYTDPENIKKELLENYHSWPVFVEEKSMDLFYNGFCNKVLWPLFHYFPRLVVYDEEMWETYRKVNSLFADEVVKIIRPDDVIWIHDYHLMLLPKLIRAKFPSVSIGFFLHIPFPSYEIFRLLPRKWGKEILNGLLDADLVGFHTYDYTQYFLRCVLRILGHNHQMGMMTLEHKLTKADTFPMGIDFNKYNSAVNLENVKKEKNKLKKGLQDLKIIFSVDRQDYTKGILNRLEGYELFLKNNPSWRQKVVLVMIIVPSRIGIEDYQEAKNMINQIIGKINGDYGDIHWTPVIYQYKSIPFKKLIALYNISDVGLVTPLRDGMNLVAKEYVAACKEKRGVLILSEMAGAAMELGDAIIINPNHREEIAEAIKKALELPIEDQERRISNMQDWLKKHDVNRWATSFLDGLKDVKEEQKKYGTVPLKGPILDGMLEQYRKSQNKILLLDYDGTLVPIKKTPAEASPDKKLRKIIKTLSKIPDLDLVIISGRNKNDLQSWYGKYNLTLVAEHGVWLKKPGKEWKMTKALNNSWKLGILRILENYQGRLPRSFIEEKEYSLVWHHRNSDPEQSELRVKEFVDNIDQFTAQNDIVVMAGKKIVEIKCSGISKGEIGGKLLEDKKYEFIMAAGDDDTDESLFQVLPPGSFTIKIGKQKSYAEYYLDSDSELLNVLEEMAPNKKGIFKHIFDFIKDIK
jgi:trehalose 6-phosphate synthase/phosphatase